MLAPKYSRNGTTEDPGATRKPMLTERKIDGYVAAALSEMTYTPQGPDMSGYSRGDGHEESNDPDRSHALWSTATVQQLNEDEVHFMPLQH